MDFKNRGDGTVYRIKWFELFKRIGVTVAGHPLEYVKVLIQIGHEPLPPKPTRTFFGRPALALPGALSYIKHIKKVDGFWGLYRGLIPQLCTNLLGEFSYSAVMEGLPELLPMELFEKQDIELSNEQKVSKFAYGLIKETAARSVSIILTHPLHIITIRTMAQFVGREQLYGGILGSVREISTQFGILGFFSGLAPRMILELLVLWVGSSAAFFINTFVTNERTLKGNVRACMAYLASQLFYPYAVVSTVTIVNNCSLKVGMPPNMPIYSDWRDCWSHLHLIGQLNRRPALFWRYYSGPYVTSTLTEYGSKWVHAQGLVPSIK